MRRSDTYNIIHAANYAALCIAILRAAPTSIEDAFCLYETGKPLSGPGNREVNHVERTCEMAAMRDAGMTWEDIGMALGLKAPHCYFSRHRHLLGGEAK
jgi:hypothetical protein